MVWRCMTYGEIGTLASIHGITNVDMLHSISSDSELNLAMNETCRFQQDNGTKHVAMTTREWLLHYFRHLLKTSSQSLDLNKLENYDTSVDKGVRDTKFYKKFDVKWALSRA